MTGLPAFCERYRSYQKRTIMGFPTMLSTVIIQWWFKCSHNERPEFAGDIPCITRNLRAHRYPGGGYIGGRSQKSNVIRILLPFHSSEIVSIPGGTTTVSTLSLLDDGFLSVGAAAGWLGLVGQSVGMHSVLSHFTVVAGELVQDACGFGGCRESEMSCNILGIGCL